MESVLVYKKKSTTSFLHNILVNELKSGKTFLICNLRRNERNSWIKLSRVVWLIESMFVKGRKSVKFLNEIEQ